MFWVVICYKILKWINWSEVFGTERFFVSYNKDNKDWAEWIAGTLEKNNYSVYLQKWDISPGDDFIGQMNKFLKFSKSYIAIWSSSFANSPYCQKEFQTAFNEQLTGNIALFLPIRVEDVPLDPLYKTTVYIDLFDKDEAGATKQLLNGIGHGDNPRKKGTFPNSGIATIINGKPSFKESKHQFPNVDFTPELSNRSTDSNSSVRDIIMLESNPNKKGDLFNRLVYDVFHALGFCQPSFNVHKVGREVDIALSLHELNRCQRDCFHCNTRKAWSGRNLRPQG